ncbi:hypothetical protein TNCV_4654191 [Trichonephila clavipes]|nr:hypothetical protein TNCV_4654191 [Trichonephila clavipes]
MGSEIISPPKELSLELDFRSCVRRLCGNNHHTWKDTCETLHYCVIPSWIARQPLTSRKTLSRRWQDATSDAKVPPLIPQQREREGQERDALTHRMKQTCGKGTLISQTTV